MPTYFDVTKEALAQLQPEGAVRLFRELLWAEAWRLHIPGPISM